MLRYCLLLLLLLVACTEKDGQDDRVFAPPISEFSVTFPVPPKLSEIIGSGGLLSTPTKMLIATHENPRLFLRADVFAVDSNFARGFTHESLAKYGFSFAENQGFASPEVGVEEEEYGTCLKVRGIKKLDDMPYMFLSRMCFGKRSVLTLYAGSPSATFPPSAALKFLESLKVK